jgi:hypothetical protein
MATRIVLAMHGMPAKDLPEDKVVELVRLHRIIENTGDHISADMKKCNYELDFKVWNWKGTPENDPFWASSRRIAVELENATGLEVLIVFNEFC